MERRREKEVTGETGEIHAGEKRGERQDIHVGKKRGETGGEEENEM